MNRVVVGMVGAARGAELHISGYKRVSGINIKLKTIFARRREQLEEACEKWGLKAGP